MDRFILHNIQQVNSFVPPVQTTNIYYLCVSKIKIYSLCMPFGSKSNISIHAWQHKLSNPKPGYPTATTLIRSMTTRDQRTNDQRISKDSQVYYSEMLSTARNTITSYGKLMNTFLYGLRRHALSPITARDRRLSGH